MEILKRFQVRGAAGEVRRTSFNGRIVDFWAPKISTPYLIVTHDGQNIFDKDTSTRRRTWELADAANNVAKEFNVPPPVIIAIFHSGGSADPDGRGKDLTPESIFKHSLKADKGIPGVKPVTDAPFPLSELRGNAYIDQITESIVPTISNFVGHELIPETTAILGASMGGLAALYGASRYPQIYRTSLAFSTHWPIGGDPLVERLMNSLPRAGEHKIWMSRGTRSHDAHYGPFQEYANTLAQDLGYRYGFDLATPVFNRTSHNERSWSSYVNQSLRFWINPKS